MSAGSICHEPPIIALLKIVFAIDRTADGPNPRGNSRNRSADVVGCKGGEYPWLSACMSSGPRSNSIERSRQTPRPVWVRPPSSRPPDGRIFTFHREGEHAAHLGE